MKTPWKAVKKASKEKYIWDAFWKSPRDTYTKLCREYKHLTQFG